MGTFISGSEFIVEGRPQYFHSWHKHGRLTHIYKCDRVLIQYGKRWRYPERPLKPWETADTVQVPSPKGLCGGIVSRPVWSHRPVGMMCTTCEEIAERLAA